MNLIVCIDENNGMLFNNRRQSRDRVLTEHIIKLIENEKIWLNNFSKDIFKDYKIANILIDDDFINKIATNEFCFVENMNLLDIEKKVNKLIIYNWNKKYPADSYFNINLDMWELLSEDEFVGNSHDKITEKIYKRREE